MPSVGAEGHLRHRIVRSDLGSFELPTGDIPYQDARRAGAVLPRRQEAAVGTERQAPQPVFATPPELGLGDQGTSGQGPQRSHRSVG